MWEPDALENDKTYSQALQCGWDASSVLHVHDAP